jgi:hypothetical protein
VYMRSFTLSIGGSRVGVQLQAKSLSRNTG